MADCCVIVSGASSTVFKQSATHICVSGRLVVIRERNDTGTDAQNHGRVNLAVRPHPHGGVWLGLDTPMWIVSGLLPLYAIAHVLVLFEIIGRHDNHCGLFLLCIKIFDHTGVHKTFPAENRIIALLFAYTLEVCENLLVERQFLEVILLQHEASSIEALGIVINDEERAADTTCVCEDSNLALSNIANDCDLETQETLAPQCSQGVCKLSCIAMHADPCSVEHNLRCSWVHHRIIFFE